MPWTTSSLPDACKNKNWSDHQKEVFVHAANAALTEYGDDGKAIAVGISAADHVSTKENAKEFPKMFYCRHMLPGIAGYENEHIMIDADAMKRACASMIGKPVYVYHQKVDLPNISDADGFVTDCFYNELDGWLWAKFIAISDDAQRAVKNKWSVSNAYIPMEWDGAGQHLNVDYDRKVLNYEFTHLAIVPNPRYEEAKIFTPEEFKAHQAEKKAQLEELQNSKPIEPKTQESGTMFFRNKKEEIKAGETILDTDFTEITNADGSKEQVTVGALKEAKRLEIANASKKNEKMIGDDEEVEIDGEKVNMGALKECYTNMKSAKKNESEEKEAKEKAEKENAEKEEKEKEAKEKEEKENSAKQFKELQNASNKKPQKIELQLDKKARGTQRYGSAASKK